MLNLQGACNLRDLGGHRTEDGRSIRPGLLFRSGVLSYLTDDDHERLASLKIRTICDLRRPEEIAKEQTRWFEPVTMNARRESTDASPDQPQIDWDLCGEGAQAREEMIALYRAMPEFLLPQMQTILRSLASGGSPLLFHCSAGKDRTGFCAGIVLHVLGVPRQTILEEFEQTNVTFDLYRFLLDHHSHDTGVATGRHPLEALDPAARHALITADRDYLSHAFARVEECYGSVDHYVGDVLNIDAASVFRLKQALLE